MKSTLVEKFIKLADTLDQAGLTKEADVIAELVVNAKKKGKIPPQFLEHIKKNKSEKSGPAKCDDCGSKMHCKKCDAKE